MSGNSLEKLLTVMATADQTAGWGALAVTSRSRLNALLRQQYIQRFDRLDFLPLFSGRVGGDDSQYIYTEVRDIEVTPPLLSFPTASLDNSKAVLTMNIVAGSCTTVYQPPGAEPMLLSTFNVMEKQAFTLEMDVDLGFVIGEVDKTGKVVLNISEGTSFRCNLDTDEDTNERMAAFFQQRFAELPRHRSVFQLGMLDCKGYNPLTPTSFRLATQAAPGAKVREALNYGDGGVVLAIELVGKKGEGTYPLPSNLPYFIPDDQEAGNDKYSAALVLAREMIPYIKDYDFDVLNNLLYPGEHMFEERERRTPRDLAVFGNVSAKQTLYTLDPAFKTIRAGETQRFTLRNWKGEVVQASRWRSVSLGSHTEEGHGTITAGLCTAPSRAHIGYDASQVVVTAEYVEKGITYTASALLRVVFDSATIAPRVTACSASARSQSVELTASSLDNAPVSWKLRAPEYGSLTQNGNRASFTADARARARGLAVQQIEATGTETSEASVLLLNAQQQLRMTPSYVSAIKKAAVVPLKDDATLLPGVPRRWKVVGGDGTVDASGRFTAPEQGITSSSVVQCEIVQNGIVFASGYVPIKHSELEPEPSWKELSQFTITVPGGPDMQRLGNLFRNGWQQLRVRILVETMPVNNIKYPLSVREKASMRLVDNNSRADIDFVGEAEGIPEGDDQVWRTSLRPNRFALAIPRSAGEDSSAGSTRSSLSVQHLYLHTRERAGETATFHATFQADSNNRWWKTTDKSSNNTKIDVTPLEIPQFEEDDYELVRKRVDGGSGGPGPGGEEDDDFWFHLRTIDYWILYFKGRPGTFGAAFETMEFLPVDGKETTTGSIRWESENPKETMFSWTGWIFHDLQKPNSDKIRFDNAMKNVVKNESLDIKVNPAVFEQGKLVISLHRSDRIPYIGPTNASRAKLSRDLAVLLIDRNGNPHRRRISFLPPSIVGDRNKLVHTLFTPIP